MGVPMIRPRFSERLILYIKQVAAPYMHLRADTSFAARSMCRWVSRFKVLIFACRRTRVYETRDKPSLARMARALGDDWEGEGGWEAVPHAEQQQLGEWPLYLLPGTECGEYTFGVSVDDRDAWKESGGAGC